MSDLKITDMYIKSGDAKYVTGNKRAARKASIEIKSVTGKAAVLGEGGKITTPAVQEIKGLPAKAAVEGNQEMWIWAASKKMLLEIQARMAAEKVFPVTGIALVDMLEKNYNYRGFDVSKKIGQCYAAPNRQVFQDAFKKTKSSEGYNKAGAAILKADKLEKARKKNADKKEKELAAAAKEKEGEKKKENAVVKENKKKKLSKNPAPSK